MVEQLIEADRGRIAALLPLRYERMRADPFAFLRGAAAVMAADFGATASTSLLAQSCGDAHLMNFGAHLTPEAAPVFDVNDFDETLPAPFEWDLKRLAASLVVAAGTRKLPGRAARALARRAARAYRLQIDELAQLPPLPAWRSRIDLEHAIEGVGARDVRRRERHRLAQVMELGREDAWRGLVARDGARLGLPERPPAVFRLGAEEELARGAFAAYHASLEPERLALLRRYWRSRRWVSAASARSAPSACSPTPTTIRCCCNLRRRGVPCWNRTLAPAYLPTMAAAWWLANA